jgi:cytidyltransferase-like protein
MSKKVVVASGYFDPMHYGHIQYLQKSKDLGDTLIVIVNNDRQASLKKGAPFMPAAERVKMVRSLECVDAAIESMDEDRTVCATLAALHPDIFANGGDQFNTSIPEAEVCDRLGIEMRDGLGGKIQSSSWLLLKAKGEEEKLQAKQKEKAEEIAARKAAQATAE